MSYVRYICDCCLQECNIKEIDIGIGQYEFWGSRGNDVRMLEVSDCCEDSFKQRDEFDDLEELED